MSERHIKQEEAFLFVGLKIKGQQVYKMSKNRMVFLRRMGNSLFGGKSEDDSAELEELGAALFACTKVPTELGSYMARPEDWSNDAAQFTVTLENDELDEFERMLKEDLAALRASEVEPLGKENTP